MTFSLEQRTIYENQALDPIYMVHIRKEYYIHKFSSDIVKHPLWCTEGRVSYSDKKTHKFDLDIDLHSILSCTFQWTKVSKHIFSHFKTPVSLKKSWFNGDSQTVQNMAIPSIMWSRNYTHRHKRTTGVTQALTSGTQATTSAQSGYSLAVIFLKSKRIISCILKRPQATLCAWRNCALALGEMP